jgi:hypothetical protein
LRRARADRIARWAAHSSVAIVLVIMSFAAQGTATGSNGGPIAVT